MKHTLTEIAFGFIIGSVGLGGCVAGCASLTPSTLECKVTAVHQVLGSNPDPDQITLFDVKDIAGRIKACAATDAGK